MFYFAILATFCRAWYCFISLFRSSLKTGFCGLYGVCMLCSVILFLCNGCGFLLFGVLISCRVRWCLWCVSCGRSLLRCTAFLGRGDMLYRVGGVRGLCGVYVRLWVVQLRRVWCVVILLHIQNTRCKYCLLFM